MIGYGLIKGVIDVGCGHQGLDGKEDLKHEQIILNIIQLVAGPVITSQSHAIQQIHGYQPVSKSRIAKLIVEITTPGFRITLTALIWSAGDHLFLRMSRQIRPVHKLEKFKESVDFG